MKKILALFLVVASTSVFSQQYKPGKGGGGLYSLADGKLDKGWYIGIGATYMFPYSNISETIEFTDTLNQTFTQDYTASPNGKFGLFGEVGLFKITGKRFINYRDFGLAYKWFRGGEDFTQSTTLNNAIYSESETNANYSDHAVSLHLNFGHSKDLSDKTFIVNGLGLNADYFIIKSRDAGGEILGQEQKFVSDILGEIHYFFGFGFKTGKRLMIMPMIETPIFAAYEFNHIKSTHDYFNTRARPFIIRIRFMFLKKGSTSCPKVYNPMGIDPDAFQNQ